MPYREMIKNWFYRKNILGGMKDSVFTVEVNIY